MGFLNGDFTPHPNSLMFNAFPCFWPFKAYWFFRKFGEIALIWDFPTPPEGHIDRQRPRRYFNFSLHH